MDLQWKIRLIDRMINVNPNSTIRDYFNIVDQEEENNLTFDHPAIAAPVVPLVPMIQKKEPVKVASKVNGYQKKIRKDRLFLNKAIFK